MLWRKNKKIFNSDVIELINIPIWICFEFGVYNALRFREFGQMRVLPGKQMSKTRIKYCQMLKSKSSITYLINMFPNKGLYRKPENFFLCYAVTPIWSSARVFSKESYYGLFRKAQYNRFYWMRHMFDGCIDNLFFEA